MESSAIEGPTAKATSTKKPRPERRSMRGRTAKNALRRREACIGHYLETTGVNYAHATFSYSNQRASTRSRLMPGSDDSLPAIGSKASQGFHPVATLAQRGKRTQRRQAQAVSWAVKSSAAEPSHHVAAPLSNQARSMPSASTTGLSTAATPICSRFHPVASLAQRGKPTQRRQAQAVSWVVKSSAAERTHHVAARLAWRPRQPRPLLSSRLRSLSHRLSIPRSFRLRRLLARVRFASPSSSHFR